MTGKYFFVLAFLWSLAAQGKPPSPPDSARVFVRWTTGKTTVYQGEPLVLQLKMYYNGNVSAPEDFAKLEIPDGWVQEIKQKSVTTRQRIGGQMYGTVTLRQYLVIPQKSGTLTIPDYRVTIKVTVPPKPDDFFQTEQTISQPLTASALALKIVSLPEPKPAGFTGAVGQFLFRARADKDSVGLQKPIRLTWLVSGNGNLKFISAPVFVLPAGLEGFDSQTVDTWQVTAKGMAGSRAFVQTLVGGQTGNYTLPLAFPYFDPLKKQYVTRTDSVRLAVAGGQNSISRTGQTPAPPNASDLPAWHTQPPNFRRKVDFLNSQLFWMLCALPVVVSMAAFGWLRREKGRRFSPHRPRRAAIRSLQRLEKQLDRPMPTGYFAGQLEKILFTYLSRRFSVSAADWHGHRLHELLGECGVPETSIAALRQTLQLYNETRFGHTPDSIEYGAEIVALKNSIFQIDQTPVSVRKSVFTDNVRVSPIFLILFFATPLTAQTPAELYPQLYRQAENKYRLRQFDSAAALLENLVRQGYSDAAIYNNLANIHAQQKQTGRAVLNYEKARRLAPGDTLIARSLQQLRQKNGLPASAAPPLATILARLDTDAVAWLAVACLCTGMASMLAMAWLGYKVMWADEFDEPDNEADSKSERNSAILFRIGLVLLGLGMALLGASSFIRHYRKTNRAYVVVAAAQGRYAPSPNARAVARLPKGSVLTETDAFAGWLKVRLTDGREVWIGRNHVEGVFP